MRGAVFRHKVRLCTHTRLRTPTRTRTLTHAARSLGILGGCSTSASRDGPRRSPSASWASTREYIGPPTSAPGFGITPATSAPGLGSPRPHRRRDLGSPQPHRRRDWAHPAHSHLHAGWALPPIPASRTALAGAHICAGTGARPRQDHWTTGSPPGLVSSHLCASQQSEAGLTPGWQRGWAHPSQRGWAHPSQRGWANCGG